MTRLAELSDEVLGQILSLASLSVATLWTAGDLALNMRIVRSCRIVATDRSIASQSIRMWPRMLSQLTALSELRIEVYGINEPIDVIKRQLLLLNPRIAHLVLRFQDAQLLFLKNAGYREGDLITASSTPSLLKTDADNLWRIGDHFTELRTVIFWADGRLGLLRLSTPFFSIFPPRLTSLGCYGNAEAGILFSALPRGMTSLSWDGSNTSALGSDSAASLPPGLTHLDGFPLKKGYALQELPRTLTTGDYSTSFGGTLLTPELMAAFPPGTRALQRCYLSMEDWSKADCVSWATAVPRFLATLDLYATLQATDLELLPRTLTSMSNLIFDYSSFVAHMQEVGQEEAYNLWPPNLTSIKTARQESHDASDIYIYPHQNLTYLELQGRSHFRAGDSIVCHPYGVPPHLTTLIAPHAFSESGLEMYDYLPTSLTHIDLGECNIWYDSLSFLHEGILTLALDGMAFDTPELAGYLGYIPSTVVKLAICSIDPEGFSWLPRGLTQLETVSIAGEVTVDHLAGLPLTLSRIKLQGPSVPKISFARSSTGPKPNIRCVYDRMNSDWVIVRDSSDSAPSMPSLPSTNSTSQT